MEARAIEARNDLARTPANFSNYNTYPPGTSASVIEALEAKAVLDRAQAAEAKVLEAQAAVTQATAEANQAQAA